ncbi:MAG TPA: hypothetical protein PKW55_06335 [Spirochaetota bacterium]|nr:hypothetical protein [Spirochaetota bacterium]HOM38501.1 hypothetical protein [Spirochaetota bacterium]HPQ49041.1 hypothetical protein [Spirochaetota bacterium]
MKKIVIVFLLFIFSSLFARMPKVYISVFEEGKIGIVLDFRENGKGLIAIMSEEGSWDIDIKGDNDVEYYNDGVLKGKLKRVGDVIIKRRTVGHEALIGQPVMIGDIKIEYYSQSESAAHYGKIMRIGDLTFTYHSYQTLPSYGKISSIRKLDTDQRIQIIYHNKDKKGLPVAGKIERIGDVYALYNKNGKVVKLDGEDDFLDIKLWSDKELELINKSSVTDDQESKVEKIVDKILGVSK